MYAQVNRIQEGNTLDSIVRWSAIAAFLPSKLIRVLLAFVLLCAVPPSGSAQVVANRYGGFVILMGRRGSLDPLQSLSLGPNVIRIGDPVTVDLTYDVQGVRQHVL